MADSPTAQEGLPAQEPISAPSAVTPAPAPTESKGHAEPAGTTPKAPEPVSEPAFFDRNEWNEYLGGVDAKAAEHLKALERQLTGQWTRKNQEISKYRTDNAEKVQAYDAFMEQVNRDPAGALKALAEQLGIKPAAPASAPDSKNYETWDQVYADFKGRVLDDVRKELGPVLTNVHKLTSQNVEQQLDNIDPDWRVYEDRITANIKAYPQMVKDLPTLYRISVPEDVLMQRAQREALKKIEKKAKAAAPAGASQVKKGPGTTTAPSNFEEAVQEAKKSLGYI